MTRKIIQILTFVLITLMFTTPAFGAMSSIEATNSAAPYQHTGEIARAYGPYTYENHPYYYVEFTTNGIETGVIIIDAETGSAVKDLEIVRKISYTDFFLRMLNGTVIQNDSKNATDLKLAAAEFNSISNRIEYNASRQKNPQVARDLSKSYLSMETIALSAADIIEKSVEIEKDVVYNGNGSYENAQKLETQYKELINSSNERINALKLVQKNWNAFYDMVIENPGFYGIDKKEAEEEKRIMDVEITGIINGLETSTQGYKKSLEQDKDEHINWDVHYAQTRIDEKNSIPGFSLLITVSALLMVGFFIKKQKK